MYQYYNAEPTGDKLEDCVIRAISLALQIPYDKVVDRLSKNGSIYSCDDICLQCYEKMLHDLGFRKMNAYGRKVKDIAKLGSVILIRIPGHLTCSIDGIVYDIWDCSDKQADCYWLVDRRKSNDYY